MNKEKINLFTAGAISFMKMNTNAYRLVPSDWVVDISNIYTMPSWEVNDKKCHPTLCFIQYISNNDEISKEVVRSIKMAAINEEYLHAAGIADVELRTKLLNKKEEKIKRLEEFIKPLTGQFLRCYYYHGRFMDGEMSSYTYLPM